MKILLALLLAMMPANKSAGDIKETHSSIELPHRLFLGASYAIVFERLNKDYYCSFAPVRPREFWIIECKNGSIRALGQYGIGLLQYEEYGTDASGLLTAVCNKEPGCLKKDLFILKNPGYHICLYGGKDTRNVVAEYNRTTGRLLYQEWMQWDLGIDFLQMYRADDKWRGP